MDFKKRAQRLLSRSPNQRPERDVVGEAAARVLEFVSNSGLQPGVEVRFTLLPVELAAIAKKCARGERVMGMLPVSVPSLEHLELMLYGNEILIAVK